MSIKVTDIMDLQSLSKMELVGGKLGLEKYVDWIYVAECFQDPLEALKWIQGGEIVFITGATLNGKMDYIKRIIDGVDEKHAAGLIINLGPYIQSIPQEAIDEANKLNLPLFTLPWEIKLTDISKEIINKIILSNIEANSLTHFLSNILFGDGKISGDVIKKAEYFGYDLDGKCCICVIDIDKFQLFLEKHHIFEEAGITRVKITFKRIIQEVLQRHGFKVPLIDKDDSVILFLKSDENYINRVNKVLLEIQQTLKIRLDGITVSIGIGTGYEDLKKMKESFKEAELAIKYLKCNGFDSKIFKYKDIGIYKLLFNVDNKTIIENYYLSVLEPILEKSKKNEDITFLQILETYLDEDCNVTTTAERLFLHRNTLKYKIKKIEELLKCDLRDFGQCCEIKIAIELGKIIKNYS